jgi:PII-like signaling protein
LAGIISGQADMISTAVTIARIYTMEGHDQLNQALDILRDEELIMGVTIIRGIAGFGKNREVHTLSLLDLSLELPLIIEFYDEPDKVEKAIQTLKSRVDFKHIISWPAIAYIDTTAEE